MAHERDRDHPPPSVPPPKAPQPLISQRKPDRNRAEHPTPEPREPVDPRCHPSRRPVLARMRAA